ncbi:MAG: glycosyltransferase family 2 protein [Thermodesulfobacteriota bacterium]
MTPDNQESLIDSQPDGMTIVIPAYNEEGAIQETLEALKDVLPRLGRTTEVLVVDDGSTDSTVELARAAGVRVIRHPVNSGYGKSLMTGILAATHDTIAIVDADGTYPISRLVELAATYDRGFQMVVGSRRGKHFDGSRITWLQRAVFRFLAEFASGRHIPDINSGFRIFDRRPVLEVRSSFSTGFSFTTTLTLLFLLTHLHVTYVPVEYHPRIGRTKVRKLKDSLRALQIIITFFAQFNPAKLFLLLLIVCWAGNVVVGFFAWALYATSLPFSVGLLIGWNTGCIIMACTALSLLLLKPSINMERLMEICSIGDTGHRRRI